MFTGIVKSVGSIDSWQDGILWVRPSSELEVETLELGESIAINGVCLTVVEASNGSIRFDLSPETVHKTTFGQLKPGDQVNLERALALGDRLGGHMVQGHVDGVGTLVSKTEDGNSTIIRFEVPEGKFLMEKGSICLDGISLTIVNLKENQFEVWVIPHTLENTNLQSKSPGSQVNVEYDMMMKYLYQLHARYDGLNAEM